MGFFKDYKEELINPADDLSQTMQDKEESLPVEELLSTETNETVLTEEAAFTKEVLPAEDEKAMEDVLADLVLPTAEDVSEGDSGMDDFDEGIVDEELLYSLLGNNAKEEKTEAEATEADPIPEEAQTEEPLQEVPVSPSAQEQAAGDTDNGLSDEDKRATTVITKGTTINGSIISDCSLDVMGTINGDVECLGKLHITGRVTGNSMASEIFVDANRLEGNINSEGVVKIANGTVVVGDITAASGVIAGAVKGEIDILGPVIIDSTAVVKGNIKAKAVQMNNGAVLEGFCSLSYASVDIDNIFE